MSVDMRHMNSGRRKGRGCSARWYKINNVENRRNLITALIEAGYAVRIIKEVIDGKEVDDYWVEVSG